MDLIHRLPKAALVTFVALLFFGGSVGFVMAATGDQSIPESMQLAEPMVGDEWRYAVDYRIESEGEMEAGQEVWNFAWGEATMVYDQNGIARHVQPLLDSDYDGSYFIDLDTHRVVAQAHHFEDEETAYRSVNLLPYQVNVLGIRPGLSSEYKGNVSGDFIFYGDEPAPCGFHSAMHEAEADLARPVTVYGDCRDVTEAGHTTDFTAFETRVINGISTVGFKATDSHGTTKLWYNAGIPYPVAMDYELRGFVFEFNLGGETHEFSLDLDASVSMTSFVRGDQPWGQPAGDLPPNLNALTLHPAGTLGVDDSGLDHPYTLTEAFTGAMNDPLYADLREFMQDHPDARAVYADYWVDDNGNKDTHRWKFLMWAGSDRMYIEAAKHIAKPGTPEASVQEVTGPEQEHWTGTAGFNFIELTVVDRERLPDTVPSVAEAFGRFEAATGLPATEYGFDYTCTIFCWGEQTHALSVAHRSSQYTEPDMVSGREGTSESLWHEYEFNEDGQMYAEYRTQREGTTQPASLLSTPTTDPGQSESVADAGAGGNRVWVPPTAEAAAGVTFVAFLVGAVYWLWPTIKSVGIFGLFSRLQPDQLLQHPVRSGIYQTVQNQPGIHYQGLVREVGKGRGVVEHHLRKLQQGGYVVSQSNGGHTCFFPKGIADHAILAAVPVLKTEGASRVLRYLVSNDQSTVSAMAAELGIAKSTASHHVRRLREAGLVEPSGPLRVAPGARKALTLAA